MNASLLTTDQSMPQKQARGRGRGDVTRTVTGSALSSGGAKTPAASSGGTRAAFGSGSADGGRRAVGRSELEQVDVRRMINRMNRNGSPSKRQRAPSESDDSASSEGDVPGTDEQMKAFQRMLQQELTKQTSLLSEQFKKTTDCLKEELLAMQQRVCELEQHVNVQGETIQQLYAAVDSRDDRIMALEGRLEDMRREMNCSSLIFSGPGVPPPPTEDPWKEDVSAVVRSMLQKYMPDTPVKQEDIVQCHREAKGRKIVCQFSRWGQASVRDTIYDSRMALMKDRDGKTRNTGEQLFISERLTPGAHQAYLKLREEKKQGRLHSVYTKHGFIFVRTRQYGAKIRVYNAASCDRVLRGEC